jgi:hypothetical protein
LTERVTAPTDAGSPWREWASEVMVAAMAEEERETSQSPDRDERETADTGGPTFTSDSGEPTAPSIGAHTKIEHVPPEERLEGHDQSTEDITGRDKRRAVKGESYGPSRTRVLMSFVVFFAIVGVVFVGLLFLVDQLDQPPDTVEAKAPWSAEDSSQQPPGPVDSRPDGAEGDLGAEQVSSGAAGSGN